MAVLLEKTVAVADNRLQDDGLASVQRQRLQLIKAFAAEKMSEYRDVNPYVAMTVGDGLGAFTKLLEKLNAVQ
jgi:hypothetical protein